jgi:hypothetical protein
MQKTHALPLARELVDSSTFWKYTTVICATTYLMQKYFHVFPGKINQDLLVKENTLDSLSTNEAQVLWKEAIKKRLNQRGIENHNEVYISFTKNASYLWYDYKKPTFYFPNHTLDEETKKDENIRKYIVGHEIRHMEQHKFLKFPVRLVSCIDDALCFSLYSFCCIRLFSLDKNILPAFAVSFAFLTALEKANPYRNYFTMKLFMKYIEYDADMYSSDDPQVLLARKDSYIKKAYEKDPFHDDSFELAKRYPNNTLQHNFLREFWYFLQYDDVHPNLLTRAYYLEKRAKELKKQNKQLEVE